MKSTSAARSTAKQRATKRLTRRNTERASRNTRAVILETALKLASRDGIEGLTIGELAKAVGMSKSGLFAHFGGKDQLQIAVLKLAVTRFVDIVLRPAFESPRGEPRIQAVFDNWLDHLNDRKALPGSSILIAASTEFDERPGPIRDFILKAQKDLIGNIEKAARMAIEEGHFTAKLDVELFAWSMYSFVLGYYHFKRMLEAPRAEDHLRRSFKTLLEVAHGRNDVRNENVSDKKLDKNLRKQAAKEKVSKK